MPANTDFCFPVRDLVNSKVKLVPFDISRHAPRFVELGSGPEMWAHIGTGPFTTVESFTSGFLGGALAGPKVLVYAILDLTKPPENDVDEGALAGMIGYLDAWAADLHAELGAFFVLPPFQRTHVASNAAGLMLRHAFAPASAGGLGLCRVSWQTGSANQRSAKMAERLGFRREGTLRYIRRVVGGRLKGKVGNGRPLPPGSGEDDLWGDMLLFGLCWDDWAAGAQEKVQTAMDRTR